MKFGIRLGKNHLGKHITYSIDFPYCSGCFKHIRRHYSQFLRFIFSVLAILFIVAGIRGLIQDDPAYTTLCLVGIVLGVLFAVGAIYAWILSFKLPGLGDQCTSSGPAVKYLSRQDDRNRFWFSSKSYAEEMRQMTEQSNRTTGGEDSRAKISVAEVTSYRKG